MKALLKTLLLVAAPFVFMAFINILGPVPTDDYLPDRCTRYCEAHGCLHFRHKYKTKEELLSKWWHKLFYWNINALKKIPRLNYRQANIVVYFIVYPLLIFVLLFRLIK